MELTETIQCSAYQINGIALTNAYTMIFNENPSKNDRNFASNFSNIAQYSCNIMNELSEKQVIQPSPKNLIMLLALQPTTIMELKDAIMISRVKTNNNNNNNNNNNKLFDEINEVDDSGNTALHYAVLNNDILTATALVREGANVNIKNNIGYSPLHYVCSKNPCLRLVKLLLDAHADANSCSMRGFTPLYCAIFFFGHKNNNNNDTKERLEIIDILLANGADPRMNGWDDSSTINQAFQISQIRNKLESYGYVVRLNKASGVWIVTSFMNHDNFPNTAKTLIGKMMFVYANKDLKKGDELTSEYGAGDILARWGIVT
eukprot:gene8045-10900_t